MGSSSYRARETRGLGLIGWRLASSLFAALALILSTPTAAATYYVATTGDDTRSCATASDSSTPKRTLSDAVSCLEPGSTLLVRGGIYPETLDSYLTAIPGGTSWSTPVTIAAYPGETPIVLPPAGSRFVLHFASAQNQYIVIDGLVLDGTNIDYDVIKISYSICCGTAHHIRITNSEVKNGPGHGILVTTSDSNEFIDLKVYDNGRADFDHGIYLASPDNLVDGCEVYQNAGWGVHVYNGISNDADLNILRNNRIHDNAAAGARGAGIVIAAGSGTIAYNNIVWRNNGGIMIDDGARNAQVFNNSIYGNNGGGPDSRYCIYVGSGSTDGSAINNICWQNELGIGDAGTRTALSNNLTVDPHFANPGLLEFQLQASSPAVDAGATLLEVPFDFDGVPRPQGSAYDIGAYELVALSAVPVLARAAHALACLLGATAIVATRLSSHNRSLPTRPNRSNPPGPRGGRFAGPLGSRASSARRGR